MLQSYYAARANLSYLWQQHPDWTQEELATALGACKSWVKKWLKRFREAKDAGVPLGQVLPGHSRARKTPPAKTDPLVVQTILSIRDQRAFALTSRSRSGGASVLLTP